MVIQEIFPHILYYITIRTVVHDVAILSHNLCFQIIAPQYQHLPASQC